MADEEDEDNLDTEIEEAWWRNTPVEKKLAYTGWVMQVTNEDHPYWRNGDYLWWESHPDATDSFGPGPFPGWRRTSRAECAARFPTISEAKAASNGVNPSVRLVKLTIYIETPRD
jgi:hypothetical protein